MTPQDVLRILIVDHGVSNRGHRTNIYNPDWNELGVACGCHSDSDTSIICAMDFSTDF